MLLIVMLFSVEALKKIVINSLCIISYTVCYWLDFKWYLAQLCIYLLLLALLLKFLLLQKQLHQGHFLILDIKDIFLALILTWFLKSLVRQNWSVLIWIFYSSQIKQKCLLFRCYNLVVLSPLCLLSFFLNLVVAGLYLLSKIEISLDKVKNEKH